MTYTEMIKLPDDFGLPTFGNNEDEYSSTEITPTPTPHPLKRQQTSSASTVHNININYRHTYSVARNNGDEIDLPVLLQSLAKHTTLESASKVLTTTKSSDPEEPIKHKRRKLILDNVAKPLWFTTLDISDPPHLKYHDDLDALVKDWDDSSYLIIKGVPIALKYWSQIFRWARPDAWDVLKDNWSNWRVMPLRPFILPS